MKNLYLLPTEKPSSLIIYNSKLKLVNYPVITPSGNQKHVYITSDEEIKEGDVVKIPCGVGKVKELTWKFGNDNPSYIIEDIFIYKLRYGQKEGELQINSFRYEDVKKIILTTDQDLIKDGVQAIDDEFLRWLVDNPSCEFVRVELPKIRNIDNYISDEHWKKEHIWDDLNIKIIIPEKFSSEPSIQPKGESKQETLEEAAERLYPISPQKRKIWINGAKWQQEQEQNNENSWFNEYQEVENYIIKRIGNKFLEATPDKYKTASEATIALLENNWKKERMYSEDDMIMFADFFHNYKELLKKEKWEVLELSKKDILKKWFEKFKKK